jgi:DNA-binding CsgD family transcriptional regulator
VDWPFTGRGGELDLLTALLDGDGGYVGAAVVGGAGVGKTRLGREAAGAAARRGWVVRPVEGTAAGQAIPLGAFAGWIERLDDQPLTLVSAVIKSITTTSDGEPVLVTVDDAHLLDDLSAFVLHQLVARGAARVIATLRSGESVPETVTALWKDGYLRRVDLETLTRPECDTLLAGVLDGPVSPSAAARIWELTHGNVLFLHQLVRQEIQGGRLVRDATGRWQWSGPVTVSATLADLVDVSIGAAPEPVTDVLDLLAVAGPLNLIYLSSLADPAAIEDAERRDLVRVSHEAPTDVVRIGHPLYAETRRARMGLMRARRLRGRIAGAMSAGAGAVAPDPVRLGVLWLDSDLPPDAEVLYRAGAEAFRRLDMTLSERLAGAAIRAGAGTEAHILHARALALLGRALDAEKVLNAIPAQNTPDSLWAAATVLRGLNLLLAQANIEQSWSVIDQALATAPPSAVQELLAFRGLQLAMAARPAEVIALADGIDRDRLAGRSKINLNFGVTIALGDLGRPQPATQAPEDAMVLAANSPVAAYQAVALALIHTDALVTNGCIGEARTIAGRVGQQWAGLPRVPQIIATAIDGVAALGYGDLATACRLLKAALARKELRPEQAGLPYLGVGYWLAVAYTEALARAGQTEAASEAMAAMQRDRHPAYSFIEPNRMLAEAWVAAARGRSSAAIELAGAAAAFARGHGQHAREVLCLQTALQFGADPQVDRLTELTGLVEGPRAALVARWASVLAGRDGHGLLKVSRDLEEMGDRIAAADAAAQAALRFESENLRGARLTASTRATTLIGECGAATPATGESAAPLPLTSREREIAALVREGLSNRQIAETLTMSVRTVEGHIYRACAKLGIANRAELGAVLGGQSRS